MSQKPIITVWESKGPCDCCGHAVSSVVSIKAPDGRLLANFAACADCRSAVAHEITTQTPRPYRAE